MLNETMNDVEDTSQLDFKKLMNKKMCLQVVA